MKVLLACLGLVASLSVTAETEAIKTQIDSEACHESNGNLTDAQVIEQAISNGKKMAARSAFTTINLSTVDSYSERSKYAGSSNNESAEAVSNISSKDKSSTNANVRELSKPVGNWLTKLGKRCYLVHLELEITRLNTLINNLDSTTQPLSVKLWTGDAGPGEISHLKVGEALTFFIQGNKNFYARAIYVDAAGDLNWVIPSDLVKQSFFTAGIPHQLPQDDKNQYCSFGQCDVLEMVIGPPAGLSRLFIFASEKPFSGNIEEELGFSRQVRKMTKVSHAEFQELSQSGGVKLSNKEKALSKLDQEVVVSGSKYPMSVVDIVISE